MSIAQKALAAFISLCLFPIAYVAKANRFLSNPSIAVSPKNAHPQFLAINQVDQVNNIGTWFEPARGTAFNISPCLMVTNQHVVFAPRVDLGSAVELKLVIRAGDSDSGKFLGQTRNSHVEVSGQRTEQGAGDWAIIKSPACLGKKFGWYLPTNIPARVLGEQNRKVMVLSYPGDVKYGGLELSFGHIRGFNNDNGNMLYDASTAPGSSGGVVFIVEDGKLRFAGVHSQGKKVNKDDFIFKSPSKSNFNEFVSSEQFMDRDDVKAMISLDIRYNGGYNIAENHISNVPNADISTASGKILY